MPDPFDDARRGLDEVPAPDLWNEASQRAASGAVVALAADGEPRRPRRWLAAAGVAAVAVLAVGTAAVLLDGDDQAVDTTPVTNPPDAGTTIGGGDVCGVGISGYPIVMGPADPPLFDLSGQPEGQLVAHAMLGSQVAELHVPGLVVTDLVGERVEDMELARGTAQIWLGPDFVQVRWFTGAQELCESFTVTVAGGSEDANRHAAVDFAERVLLPSDLGDLGTVELDGTTWALERSTVAGVPTDGNSAGFAFADGEATWTDGCNDFGARYTQPSPTELVLGDISATELPCPTNPTSQAIVAVMSTGTRIDVARGSGVDALFLTTGDTTLTLRPVQPGAETTTTIVGEPPAGPELTDTEWRVVGLYHGDEVVLGGPSGTTPHFTFGDATVAWSDRCNASNGTYALDPEGFLIITYVASTLIGCPEVDGRTQVWEVIGAVMGAERISVRETGGRLELSGGENDRIVLERV